MNARMRERSSISGATRSPSPPAWPRSVRGGAVRSARRTVRLISASLLIVLAACSEKSGDTPPDKTAALRDSTTDLLARAEIAWASTDVVSPGGLDVEDDQYFTLGWLPSQKTLDGVPYRWMGPRVGAIDLQLVEPEALTLRLTLAPARGENIPPLHLKQYWNGKLLGSAELAQQLQVVQTAIPKEFTRAGPNRLELVPDFWVDAAKITPGAPSKEISVNLLGFEIQSQTHPSTQRPVPARTVLRDDAAILQYPDTVLTFAVHTARAPHLRLAGSVVPMSQGKKSLANDVELAVIVTGVAGDSRELLRLPLAGANALDRTLDLSSRDKGYLAVSLILRWTGATSPPDAPAYRWDRIELVDRIPESPGLVTSSPSPPPNIVVVLFDTLRADHLEPYGAQGMRTPNFTRFAGQGATFTRAVAHTSWTRPSVATLLTSLYETAHRTSTWEDKLAATVPYLPELLQQHGYHTVGVSLNGHITRQWGFDRGFDQFHELGKQRPALLQAHPGPEAFAKFLWESYVDPSLTGDGRPFFLYLHELDPHAPYTPPEPFASMYPTGYRGDPDVADRNIHLVRLGLMDLADADIDYLHARYRGEVSFADAELGALMDCVEVAGLAENTIFVVLSDHGEEFGEHGGIGHSVTLYDEVLRVPMLWSWPGHIPPGKRIDAEAGLVDLVPTLFSLIGIEPSDSLQGRSLAPYLLGPAHPALPRPMVADKGSGHDRALHAVRVGDWKFIEREKRRMPDLELYDLADDPKERTNRWAGELIRGYALRQWLAWHLQEEAQRAAPAPERVPAETLDPETVEELRNLGYLR